MENLRKMDTQHLTNNTTQMYCVRYTVVLILYCIFLKKDLDDILNLYFLDDIFRRYYLPEFRTYVQFWVTVVVPVPS